MSSMQRSSPEHEPVTSRFEAREWQFSNITSVLYKRRWIAIIAFLVGAAVVTAYALTVTPIYQAHAQLLLEEKPSIVTFQGVGVTPTEQKGYLETQQRVLQSRSLARRVIDQLDLWNAPGFTTAAPEPGSRVFEFFKRGESRPSSAVKAGNKETTTETIVIDRMLSHLSVVPIRETRILEVRYESPDPALAARVVNALTTTFISHLQETQSHESKEANAWLTDQLAEQRRKVELSELALQNYREQEKSLSLDAGQNIVIQRLNALNSSVTQAKTDRIAIESRYRQLAASQNDQATLDTFPEIRINSSVQEIRSRLTNLQRERMQLASSLGAKHPEMVRLDGAISVAERELTNEVAKTVDSVHQEYLAALSREKELTAALEHQKGSALALNRQGIEFGVLLREVESDRQIYQSLLQRANEAAVSSNMQGDNVEIVDPAEVPRSPVRPNRRTNMMIGLLVSSILAVGMALVLEAFDSRVQTPADIKDGLQLPFLGMLPYVSKRALRGERSSLAGACRRRTRKHAVRFEPTSSRRPG